MEYHLDLEKEGNSIMWNIVNEPGGYYARWKQGQKQTNIAWFHLYETFKIVKYKNRD